MKTNSRLVLAAFTGIAIGVVGATATIHAQQARTPPAYVIAEGAVNDPATAAATLKPYIEKMPETLAPFDHRFIVRGGKTQALEGEPPKSIVVIAFDSAAKAREWYDSPAYAAIRPIRQNATKSRVYIVEGLAP